MTYDISPLTGNATVHLTKREVRIIGESLDFMEGDEHSLNAKDRDQDLIWLNREFAELDAKVNPR